MDCSIAKGMLIVTPAIATPGEVAHAYPDIRTNPNPAAQTQNSLNPKP